MSHDLRLRLVVAAALAILPASLLRAQSSGTPQRGPVVERIDLPADRQDEWPRGVEALTPVARDEFLRLWKLSRPDESGPAVTPFPTATFRGILAGRDLVGQELSVSVSSPANPPAWLPFGPWTPALSQLRWTDGPAVWGRAPGGQTLLQVDRMSGELVGRWSLRGDARGDEIHFDWQSPRAAVTRLELETPRDFVVTSDTGDVRKQPSAAGSPAVVWELHLGPTSEAHFSIGPERPPSTLRPRILADQEITSVVNEGDLSFEAVCQLEVHESPVQLLKFDVPAGVEVFSASIGGDIPLDWSVAAMEDRRQLSVRLPDPIQGRIRLVLDGIATLKPGQAVSAPQIVLRDAIFVSGKQAFVITPPLELRSIRGAGFRQQSPITQTPVGDSLSFQMLGPEGQVLLEVRRPQATLSTQVLGQLQLGSDDWSSMTDVVWTATSGAVFQTNCRIPAHWDVSEVQPAPWVSNSQLASWDVQSGAGGASTLTLEFYEAITPGSPRGVRIYLRRAAPALPLTGPPPLPQAIEGELDDFGLEIVAPPSLSILPGDNSNLTLLAPASTPTGWLGTAAAMTPAIPTSGTVRRFRCGQGDSPGELTIEATPGPEGPGCDVSVAASPTAVHCEFTLRVQPRWNPDSRVLWYVAGPVTAIDWGVNGVPLAEPELRRLPTERHAEWKLPESGTLWEWTAPRGTGDDIVVHGTATLRWTDRIEIPLVFLPELTGGLYQVTLVRTAPDIATYDDQGLSLLSFDDSPMIGPRAEEAGRDTRVWRYDSPDDQLRLTRREAAAAGPEATSASLLLDSLISANSGGIDLHRATLSVARRGGGDSLVVTLPPGTRLLELWRDGERQTVPPVDLTLRIPLDVNRSRHSIEMLYEAPARSAFLMERQTVVLPKLDCPVTQFRWRFSLPPGSTLATPPSGAVLEAPLPATSWARRFLGPLGRASGEPIFNPLSGDSWRRLWVDAPATPVGVSTGGADFAIPEEWTTRIAESPVAPAAIELTTWDGLRLRLFEWIIFLGVMLVGVLLRIRRPEIANRIAAIWLGLWGGAALCMPSPLETLAGSACAGMLLAIAAPRSLLTAFRWELASSSGVARVPGGSTQSFRYTPPAVGLLIAAGMSMAAAQPPAGSAPGAASPKTWKVYVLIDDDRQPSRVLPLVYLDPELLLQLRSFERTSARPAWLLRSAAYDVSIAPDRSAEVKADFQVTVTSRKSGNVIDLPLSGGSLKNRDGCRVDGRPVVAVRATDESGWLIPLPIDDSGAEPRSVRIELDLLTPPSAAGAPAVALKIPPVVSATATVRCADAAEWTISKGLGSRTLRQSGTELQAQLGSVDELSVAPATASLKETAPVQIDVRMVQTVDCRSAWSEVRFRCRCTSLQGSLRSLRLRVPVSAVVREVRGDALGGYRIVRDASSSQEVLLTFQPEERAQWMLEGTLLVPQNPSEPDRPIPVVQPVSTDQVQIAHITTVCGLGSTPDHRIELREADDPALTLITAEAFVQTWGDTGLTVRPHPTFEIRPGNGNPSFRLTNTAVERRALRWNQTGTFRPRRMEWVVQGELETSGGAWNHALIVDRRLRIESITVEENGADRLLKRAESRLNDRQNRIVLFLGERTTGLQNITIRASGPVRLGSPQPLPGIWCEGTALIDGRISLYCDPELLLDMPSTRGLERLEASEEPASNAEAPTLFGRFQVLEPDVTATLRVVSRLGRCSARNAVAITPAEQSQWRLRGRLEMTPADPSTREMACDLPADWGPKFEFTVEGARVESQSLPTGVTRLVLQRVGSMTDPVFLNYGVELAPKGGREWSISLPQPQQCPQIETVVGIPPSDDWEASPEQGVIPGDSRPEWLKSLWGDWSQESAMTLVRPRREALLLVRRAAPPERMPREIPFMEHRLAMTSDDEIAGTSLLLVRPGAESIDISVPAEIQLHSALEGERPLEMTTTGPGQVRLLLDGGGSTSLLLLNWSRKLSTDWAPVEQRVFTLPVPVGLVPKQHWISLESAPSDWLVPRTGIEQRTVLDQALTRLEILLLQRPPDPQPAWYAALLQWSYGQVAAALPAAAQTGDGQSAAQMERWNRLVEIINQRKIRIESPGAASGLFWQSSETAQTGVSGEVLSITGDLRLWQVRRQDLLWWVLLPMAALLASILLRWMRRPYAEWLEGRPSLSWLLLGLGWWLWITPSFVGLLLVAAGLWVAFRQRPAAVAGTLVG